MFQFASRSLAPAGTTALGLLFRWWLLLGAVGLLGLALLLPGDGEEGLRALSHTARNPTAAELAQGHRWFAATLQRTTRSVPPWCVVIHEHYVSGKNGGWREDDRWTFETDSRVTLPEGGEAMLGVHRAHVVEPQWVRVSPEHEREWRGRAPSLAYGGRLRETCAEPEAPVWVDGCLSAPRAPVSGDPPVVLGDCGAQRLELTLGASAPQRARDAFAHDVLARVTRILAAALVVLLSLSAVRSRASLSTRAALLKFTPQRSRRRYRVAGFAMLLVACVYAVLSWVAYSASDGVSRQAYWLGFLGVAGVCFVLEEFRAQGAALRRALAPVLRLPTVPLMQASGNRVEVAVRVARDAPVHTGRLSGKPRAWSSLEIVARWNEGKVARSQVLCDQRAPQEGIPVEDESGRGVLELQRGSLDVRVVECTVRASRAPDWVKALVPSALSLPDATLVLREHYLEPGEELYLLGHVVQEVSPGEVGYRSEAHRPRFSAKNAEELLVYAGNEGGLRRTAQWELTYGALRAGGIALLALLWALSAVWLCAW